MKAAALIGTGFIATALGTVSTVAGTAANAAGILDRYPTQPGTAWVVIGMILAVAGVAALAWGFVKLATNIEYLVDASDFLLQAEKARREARREA